LVNWSAEAKTTILAISAKRLVAGQKFNQKPGTNIPK